MLLLCYIREEKYSTFQQTKFRAVNSYIFRLKNPSKPYETHSLWDDKINQMGKLKVKALTMNHNAPAKSLS